MSDCDHSYVYKKDDNKSHTALEQMSGILAKLTNLSNDIGEQMKDIYDTESIIEAKNGSWKASEEIIGVIDKSIDRMEEVRKELKRFRGKLFVNKSIEGGNYKYLIEKFGEKKISSRYDWINDLLNGFVLKFDCMDKVIISQDILKHVVVDYFVDIDRLKEFQEIEKVHASKIYAYISFWLLRHKPLQVICAEGAKELAFINEECVCYLLRSYLFSEPENVPILENKKEQVDNFIETMLYFFQYRDYSAKNIELMILAFQAGCGYQYSADHQ